MHIHLIQQSSTSLANQKTQQDSCYLPFILGRTGWATCLSARHCSAQGPRRSPSINNTPRVPNQKRLLLTRGKTTDKRKPSRSQSGQPTKLRAASPITQQSRLGQPQEEERWAPWPFPQSAATLTAQGISLEVCTQTRCHHTNVRHTTERLCKEHCVKFVYFLLFQYLHSALLPPANCEPEAAAPFFFLLF